MKYWMANCSNCGPVKIKQARLPRICSEQIKFGSNFTRSCGVTLTGLKDITTVVEAARAKKERAAA